MVVSAVLFLSGWQYMRDKLPNEIEPSTQGVYAVIDDGCHLLLRRTPRVAKLA